MADPRRGPVGPPVRAEGPSASRGRPTDPGATTAILDAALRLVAERGYRATTTEQVAAAAWRRRSARGRASQAGCASSTTTLTWVGIGPERFADMRHLTS